MSPTKKGFAITLIWLSIAAACMLFSSCGKAPQSQAKAVALAIREIEIRGNDSMKFDVTTIVATPGETLRIVLINAGTQPKEAMGHNWILLKRQVNVSDFVNAAVLAKETGYIPASQREDILAYTRLLGPGERDVLTVTVPRESGRYVYLCSFPAHCQLGMRGVLIVQ
jgi:azurin